MFEIEICHIWRERLRLFNKRDCAFGGAYLWSVLSLYVYIHIGRGLYACVYAVCKRLLKENNNVLGLAESSRATLTQNLTTEGK